MENDVLGLQLQFADQTADSFFHLIGKSHPVSITDGDTPWPDFPCGANCIHYRLARNSSFKRAMETSGKAGPKSIPTVLSHPSGFLQKKHGFGHAAIQIFAVKRFAGRNYKF